MTPGHKYLRRLDEVHVPHAVYFVTTCTAGRARCLGSDGFHAIALEVWANCLRLSGWAVGRYVVMPDHVHFFVGDAREERPLGYFVGQWKEWTAKYVAQRLGHALPLWQREFHDHVIRSSESYEQKWEYVRENPVRAGLVAEPAEWPWQGVLNDLRYE